MHAENSTHHTCRRNSSHPKHAQFIYLIYTLIGNFLTLLHKNTIMASSNSCLLQNHFAISSLTLLLSLISLPPSVLSQNPTIAQCTTQLLPLAACAPFVQGSAMSPAQSCCVNLKLLYSQQPECLCLLLNGTTLSAFPINTTRALQLPVVCSLQVDISTCPGNF